MKAGEENPWQTFSVRLDRFIRRRVGDDATAQDIRQDVLLRLQKRLAGNGGIGDIEAWLFRSARNAVIDHYRTRKPLVELPDDLSADEPETGGELEALRAAFRRMVDELPEPYREAVVLADLEGLEQRAVAERLGLSLSGAKSRIQRGRRQLKQSLIACCSFDYDRRGRVIDCTPRTASNCPECG